MSIKSFERLAIFPGSELDLIRRFMVQQGIAEQQWLLGSGLQSEQLDRIDQAISMHQFDAVYRNIYRLLPQPCLGLRFGLSLNLSRWGMLSSALLCAETLGHALSIAKDYRIVLRSRFSMENSVEGDYLKIKLKPRSGMKYPVNEVFAHEVFIGTLVTQITQLLGKPFRFHQLSLPYSEPVGAKAYQKLVDSPPIFDASIGSVTIPLQLIESRLPLCNRVTRKVTLLACQDELARIQHAQAGDVVFTVMGVLSDSGSNILSLNELAEKLSISPRTLRRRLQLAGTNFRELSERQRQQMALQLLSDERLTLREIAVLCGFSDSAGFHKAFKRWTGGTPVNYRQRLAV